ncbi:GspE/PulE family protein [Paucibacter sp. B51]|uniref:GspE/PulE family protein n=1 Tax=Paucibacter sp. B51 TaxID=2993315 RepID=UPI0022EBB6FB|nr:GspE/PulE family protein [Paucibacter sp. B51]
MPTNHAWLLAAARHLRPGAAVPAVEIAKDLGEAWAQVAALFHLSAAELASGVAQTAGLEVGSMSLFRPGDGSALSERMCRQTGLLPLWQDATTMCVALSDPQPIQELSRQLAFAAGRPVRFVVLPPDDIDTGLTRLFADGAAGVADRPKFIDLQAGDAHHEGSSTPRLFRAIFQAALDRRASDVHIHPFVGGGAIRFRVDGLLRRIATVPMHTLEALSRFLKANAGLENTPLKPQDGRLRLRSGQREIDVRLSILPAYDGDRIVCRLLDQGRNFSLQQGHFSSADQLTLRRFAAHSSGIVLLTGPTGSGKTSTLYALLSELNCVEVNIMTIENPVEYVLPGISQIQVNDKQGLSFAETLRSVLRQDPDIVLVGEIRDAETARVAGQAALTGHLVLSTLHTNDALGTLPRLQDLGLDPGTVADALVGVVSQRLVRRLCFACRCAVQLPLTGDEADFQRITGELPAYRPVGCPQCEFSGYRGQLPVIEHLEMTPALRQAVRAGRSDFSQSAELLKDCHRSIAASAKDWIVSGETTPSEVQRVLSMKFWTDLAAMHSKVLGSLSLGLRQDQLGEARLTILMLSADIHLAEQLRGSMAFDLVRVADENAAADHMARHGNVIALVIDTASLDDKPSAWLQRLRAKLAWSGLPALFIARQGDDDLRTTLQQFHASVLDASELNAQSLAQALSHLLKGGPQ